MNQVKTYIDKSSIHGIGLFAGEFIPEGALIWKFSGLDQMFTEAQFLKLKLTGLEAEYFDRYGFGKDKVYIHCADDAKYCNHSDNPNTGGYPEQYATRDIFIGEEITCDYRQILRDDGEREDFEIGVSKND